MQKYFTRILYIIQTIIELNTKRDAWNDNGNYYKVTHRENIYIYIIPDGIYIRIEL